MSIYVTDMLYIICSVNKYDMLVKYNRSMPKYVTDLQNKITIMQIFMILA